MNIISSFTFKFCKNVEFDIYRVGQKEEHNLDISKWKTKQDIIPRF